MIYVLLIVAEQAQVSLAGPLDMPGVCWTSSSALANSDFLRVANNLLRHFNITLEVFMVQK